MMLRIHLRIMWMEVKTPQILKHLQLHPEPRIESIRYIQQKNAIFLEKFVNISYFFKSIIIMITKMIQVHNSGLNGNHILENNGQSNPGIFEEFSKLNVSKQIILGVLGSITNLPTSFLLLVVLMSLLVILMLSSIYLGRQITFNF